MPSYPAEAHMYPSPVDISQMIQCHKWSNVSNDPTTFEKGFSSSFNACDNQGLVCICVYKSPLFNKNRGWCSKPCYAISYGRKSKLEKAGHFEAQTCDRPWGRGWGGGQGGRLIQIRRLAQMHKYTNIQIHKNTKYTNTQTIDRLWCRVRGKSRWIISLILVLVYC